MISLAANQISPSTQPPPRVPIEVPSDRIRSLAPVFWGVDPLVRTTVASTQGLDSESSAIAPWNISFMTLLYLTLLFSTKSVDSLLLK